MAVNLPQTVRINLGGVVASRLDAFRKARSESQQTEEMQFYEQVAKGMSYKDQAAFRKGQLEREMKRTAPDEEYLKQVRKEVANLNKLAASDRLKAAYLDSYTKLATGMKTMQEHIDFLQSELSSSGDPESQELINGYLSQAKQSQYKQEQAVADNYYTFAQNDKTEPVLLKALSDVKSEKAKALGGGDALRASVLDLKEQSLNQKLMETRIENSVHQFGIAKLKAYNPSDYLDSINQKIDSATTDRPITFNGQTYANEKEYWLATKANYFNSGEFDKANQNYYADLVQMNYNKSQVLFPSQMKSIADEMNGLLNRPDLADFKPVIAGSNAMIISKASELAAKSILDNVDVTYEFQTAADKLAKLSKDTGVDQTSNYNMLLSKTAAIKQTEVNAILSQAGQYAQAGQSEQQAVQNAIKDYQSGKLGVQTSPSELATGSPEETAKAAAGQSGAKPAGPLKTPGTFYNEGELVKAGNNATVYRVEGGKLRPIAPDAGVKITEDLFKQNFGKGFGEVKQVNSIAELGLPTGENIMVKGNQPKVYKAKIGQKLGTYAPETEFILEGNTLRPISSLQAKQKVAPDIKAEEVDTSFFNDKKIGAIY